MPGGVAGAQFIRTSPYAYWDTLFAHNPVVALPAPAISRDNPPLLKILSVERL